jgi:FOG: TPR repeat, SEL1 subfamily
LKILKAKKESTRTGTSSSSSSNSSSKDGTNDQHSPNQSWSRTIKNSSPLSFSDRIQYMQHQVVNDRVLSADAHLALALSALPFEQNDNALYAQLYHSETLPVRGMEFVQEENQHEYEHEHDGDDNDDRAPRRKEHVQNTHGGHTATVLSQQEAIFHLEQSAQLGNPYAQNMLANILASGILPMEDPRLSYWTRGENGTTGTGMGRYAKKDWMVPSDFAEGGQQLARALVLWHMSAMGGNIEAAMALAYRHFISATSGEDPTMLVEEDDMGWVDGGRNGRRRNEEREEMSRPSRWNIQPRNKKRKEIKHSADGFAHYGVLGTCQTSLAYYEAAANGIMDELESGPLRGKVLPARDEHKLAEIHQRGASSKLAPYNKPDELEEAIKYFKIRANNVHNPDLGAAHKLANMYHYGLKGVKQDMKEALKYYEIAADLNSWEAAGQAGKFHLWGMGVDGKERDLKKALEYFRKGTPGGLNACKLRLQKKLFLKKQNVEDDLWESGEIIYNCDHPSVNGMGLLHLYGVPMMVRNRNVYCMNSEYDWLFV